jgi:hypothetical protein
MQIIDNGSNANLIKPPDETDVSYEITITAETTQSGGSNPTTSVSRGINLRSYASTSVKTEGNLSIVPFPPSAIDVLECLDPTIATLNGNKLEWVSNGTARVLAKILGITRQAKFAVSTVAAQEFTEYLSFAAGTFGKDVTDAIDGAIAAVTAETAATVNTVYSTQNHTDGIYVRNPDCWAKDFDLTCTSPWNSTAANGMAGTAISPRHVVFAQHWYVLNNATMRFVTQDNQVITRTLKNSVYVGASTGANKWTDINIGILDADLPESITPAKILPADWTDYFPTTSSTNSLGTTHLNALLRFPILYLDQEEKALVGEWMYTRLANVSANNYPHMGWVPPAVNSTRRLLYELPISGDSGNPNFAIVNGETVLLFCFYGAGGGPDLSQYKTEIEAAMATLSNGQGLSVGEITNGNTPYTLSIADLSGFTNTNA